MRERGERERERAIEPDRQTHRDNGGDRHRQACGESRHTDRQAEMTETMNGTHYALLLPHLDNITRVFCLIHVL